MSWRISIAVHRVVKRLFQTNRSRVRARNSNSRVPKMRWHCDRKAKKFKLLTVRVKVVGNRLALVPISER